VNRERNYWKMAHTCRGELLFARWFSCFCYTGDWEIAPTGNPSSQYCSL